MVEGFFGRWGGVIALQETHATKEELELMMPRLSSAAWWFCSEGASHAEGGVAIAVSRSLFPAAQISQEEVVPGRALRVKIVPEEQGSNKSIILWNVHNFGMDAGTAQLAAALLESDLLDARREPESFAVYVCGDWNYIPAGEGRWVPTLVPGARGEPRLAADHSPAAWSPSSAAWAGALASAIEVHQRAHTHFCKAGGSFARLDRVYWGTGTHLAEMMSVRAGVTEDPETMLSKGLSDHSLVHAVIAVRAPRCAREQPLARGITEDPFFREQVARELGHLPWEHLGAAEKLYVLKRVFRVVGARVRRAMVRQDFPDEAGRRQLLLTLSRALLFNDPGLARKALSGSAYARRWVAVRGGVVVALSPDDFRDELEKHVRGGLSDSLARTTPDKKGAKSSARAAFFRRRLAAWSPLDRRLRVHAIIAKGGGERIYDLDGQLAELARHWKETFTKDCVDERAGRAAERLCKTWCFEGCAPPGRETFELIVKKCSDSAPGPDGIPYSAWRAALPWAVDALSGMSAHLASGGRGPTEWNWSCLVFPPKGERREDSEGIARQAVDTRPLSLKNSDNKLVCHGWLSAIKGAIVRNAAASQNGFVPTRNLVQNIVDLDTAAHCFNLVSEAYSDSRGNERGREAATEMERQAPARVLPMQGGRRFPDTVAAHLLGPPALFPENPCTGMGSAVRGPSVLEAPAQGRRKIPPALCFFDFAAAFPSVLHSWLHGALRASGFPEGFRNVVSAMYWDCLAMGLGASGFRPLFRITSGVLQGCPLSGALFVVCLNPFLEGMERAMAANRAGVVRACADDIGAALRCVSSLSLLSPFFALAERAAGLVVKPPKCNVVPIGGGPFVEQRRRIQRWLKKFLPQWSNFAVVGTATYLGMEMGCPAGDSRWTGALRKARARVAMLAASPLSPAAVLAGVASRAVPCLTYLAQLLGAPPRAVCLDVWIGNKVLRLPGNSLNAIEVASLQPDVLRTHPPVSAICLATASRAALVTFKSWRTALAEIEWVALHTLPLAQAFSDRAWGGAWASPPLAVNLSRAAGGCVDGIGPKRWRHAFRSAVGALCAEDRAGTRPGVQGRLTKQIWTDFVARASLFEMLLARLCAWYTPARELAQRIDMQELVQAVSAAPEHLKINWVRTWANGWPTSARMHASVILPCVWQCGGGRDELKHYVSCPALLSSLEEVKGSVAVFRRGHLLGLDGAADLVSSKVVFTAYGLLQRNPSLLPARALRAAWRDHFDCGG